MEEETTTHKHEGMIAGIDFSLTGPAFCVGHVRDLRAKYCTHYYVGAGEAKDNYRPFRLPKQYRHLTDRVDQTIDIIITRLQKHFVERVYVESIAYRARSFQVDQAYGTQRLFDTLQDRGFDVHWANISSVKKRFTGNGRASKVQMYKKYLLDHTKYDTLPVRQSAVYDIADSYAIMLVGEEIYNERS